MDAREHEQLSRSSEPSSRRLNAARGPLMTGPAPAAAHISAVQRRQATAADQPWIQAQQAALANGSTTLAGVRQNLADFAGEAGVVTELYQGLGGRTPSAAEISDTEAQLAAGASLQTIRASDAGTPEVLADLKGIIGSIKDAMRPRRINHGLMHKWRCWAAAARHWQASATI